MKWAHCQVQNKRVTTTFLIVVRFGSNRAYRTPHQKLRLLALIQTTAYSLIRNEVGALPSAKQTRDHNFFVSCSIWFKPSLTNSSSKTTSTSIDSNNSIFTHSK